MILFKTGNVVMVQVAVQSNAKKGVVQKFLYLSCGLFVVISDEGFGAHPVRPYGKPDVALQKFLACDLSLLPQLILSYKHLDTLDMCYLNYNYTPLQHPLSESFDNKAYNTAWFDD